MIDKPKPQPVPPPDWLSAQRQFQEAGRPKPPPKIIYRRRKPCAP